MKNIFERISDKANYTEETDPLKRLSLLDAADCAPSYSTLRRELFILRYSEHRGKGGRREYADRFLAFWLLLKTYDAAPLTPRNKRKACRDLLREAAKIKIFSFGDQSPLHRSVMEDELYNLTLTLIDACASDPKYNKKILGFGSLSDDALTEKISKDISDTMIDLPRALGLESEFAPLISAAGKVLSKINQTHPRHQ